MDEKFLGKVLGKPMDENIHPLSKYHLTDYLLITKQKTNLNKTHTFQNLRYLENITLIKWSYGITKNDTNKLGASDMMQCEVYNIT